MNNRAYVFALIGLALCAVLLSAFTWQWWNASEAFTGHAIRYYWVYAWEIEQWQAVAGQCDYTGCYPEHSYNHTTDTDCTTIDGKRRCDTDYLYTLNQWRVIATQYSNGEGNEDRPFYPTLDIAPCDTLSPSLGCQRAGKQIPHHYFVVETLSLVENFQGTCETTYGNWIERRFEDAVSGRYFSNRNKIDCSTITFE